MNFSYPISFNTMNNIESLSIIRNIFNVNPKIFNVKHKIF